MLYRVIGVDIHNSRKRRELTVDAPDEPTARARAAELDVELSHGSVTALAPTDPQPSPASPAMFASSVGGLMIIGGLFAAVYFFFFFDTSVEVPSQQVLGQSIGGGRVNNLGLMAQRQNGIIFGFGVSIVGAR